MIKGKKEIGRVYFGIGIDDMSQRWGWSTAYFFFFKLIAQPPAGEEMKRGRDYKGFILKKSFGLPRFEIQKSWKKNKQKNERRCTNCFERFYPETIEERARLTCDNCKKDL